MQRLFVDPFDPGVIKPVNSFACVLQSLGRCAEAEPLSRDAVARAVASPNLGPGHPNTKAFVSVHANILDALGRQDDDAAIRERFGIAPPATKPATGPSTQPATPPTPAPTSGGESASGDSCSRPGSGPA